MGRITLTYQALSIQKIDISVIISVRLSPERSDILERLQFSYFPNSSKPNNLKIEWLIIDDGSKPEYAKQLADACTHLDLNYLQTDANPKTRFNLARARNVGVQNALGRYVLFLDADILVHPEFYTDLMTQITACNLDQRSDLFLMLPIIYLTQQGHDTYNKLDAGDKKFFGTKLLKNANTALMEHYSHGTSCILVNRLYYLSIGGQNENFEGWGYEDYEFTTRMINLAPLFPRPQNYTAMKGNFMVPEKIYEGWKAEYRLYGAWLGEKGLYGFHVPHAIDKKYHNHKQQNLSLFKKSLGTNWATQDMQPIFLHQEYSMVLAKNPFCYDYKLNAILGDHTIIDLEKYMHFNDLMHVFHQKGYTQIILPNPYKNQILTQIYQHCRTHKIKYRVCERGALPDSIFHDPNGFLYDSTSYAQKLWDHTLCKPELNAIESYINDLRTGSDNLERQPTRSDLRALNLKETKIKIVIILQTQNDTVIKHFGKQFCDLQSMKQFAEHLLNIADDKLEIIYKNHPLEANPIVIDNAVNADQVHIHDLIHLADAIITVNSGAGLIAAALKKKVFVLGNCWYYHENANIVCAISSPEAFLVKLDQFMPDAVKIDRFIHYLRFKFYAFGVQQTILHKKATHNVNATLHIHYYEVQTSHYGRLYFKHPEVKIGFDHTLFNDYRSNSKEHLQSEERQIFAQQAVKAKKWQKLRHQPFLFFLDMLKNILR